MSNLNWMNDALCKEIGPELFFPREADATVPDRVTPATGFYDSLSQARAVCAVCPVRNECLEYAINNGETHGVWGGVAARSLKPAIAKRKKAMSQ